MTNKNSEELRNCLEQLRVESQKSRVREKRNRVNSPTHCLLPTATAYCRLPTAYCRLPTADCLLPSSLALHNLADLLDRGRVFKAGHVALNGARRRKFHQKAAHDFAAGCFGKSLSKEYGPG